MSVYAGNDRGPTQMRKIFTRRKPQHNFSRGHPGLLPPTAAVRTVRNSHSAGRGASAPATFRTGEPPAGPAAAGTRKARRAG